MLGHAQDMSTFDATAKYLKRQVVLLQIEAHCFVSKQVLEQVHDASFAVRLGKSCGTASRVMNEDTQKKAAPARAAKKSEGWREREESNAAGTAPRMWDRRTPSLVLYC